MQKMPRSVWWIPPVILVAGAVGAISYYRANPMPAPAPTIRLATVTTTQVTTGSVSTGITATGTLRANRSASLAWSLAGQVAMVMVNQGDRVPAGQVLASIDPASSPVLLSAQASLKAAQQNLANLENVAAAQANAQMALLKAQTAVTSAQTALDNLTAMPTQEQIDGATAQVLVDEQAVNRAQAAYDTNAWRPENQRAPFLTILQTAIARENADKAALDALKNYKPDPVALAQDQANLAAAQAQLAAAQSNFDAAKNGPDPVKVAAAQATINSIQSTLAQQNITAPFAGVISVVKVKPGDRVVSGTAAFQMDDTSALYVDLQVPAVVIKKVALGQTVALTFAAIPAVSYTGTVAEIPPAGTLSGGASGFKVAVALAKVDAALKPGLPASARLITQQVNNILVVPSAAVATVGAQKVIYILANNLISPESVTVGLASDTQVEVSSPTLKAGDIVVTNPAALALAATSSNNPFFTSLFTALGMTKGSSGASSSIQVVN